MAEETLENQMKTILRDLGILGRKKLDDHEELDGQRTVPLARLKQVIEERNEYRDKLADLAARVEELDAGYQASVAEIKEQAATQVAEAVEAKEALFRDDLALTEMGLSDEYGRDALRKLRGTLPEDEQGESLSAFWQSRLEAHQAHLADPKKVQAPKLPKVLQPYLPSEGGTTKRTVPNTEAGARVGDQTGAVTDKGLDAYFASLK